MEVNNTMKQPIFAAIQIECVLSFLWYLSPLKLHLVGDKQILQTRRMLRHMYSHHVPSSLISLYHLTAINLFSEFWEAQPERISHPGLNMSSLNYSCEEYANALIIKIVNMPLNALKINYFFSGCWEIFDAKMLPPSLVSGPSWARAIQPTLSTPH